MIVLTLSCCRQRQFRKSTSGRTVQVIVKLANIVLTLEQPKYPGGSWHVEGMMNETHCRDGPVLLCLREHHRVATRIPPGRRQRSRLWDVDGLREQLNDNIGYHTVYGFSQGDALNQKLGHIVAQEEKCVGFPNIYQHRVDGFELADSTKPGYRKILCFFFVDPLARISRQPTSRLNKRSGRWTRCSVPLRCYACPWSFST